jgi:hypothetical protein
MLFPLHRATLPVHAIQGSIPTFSILVSLKNTKLLSIQFFQKNSMPGPDVQQVHARSPSFPYATSDLFPKNRVN